MIKDTPNKFSPTTLILHWVVGITMIALLAIGVYMEEYDVYSLYPWHKSFGFLIIFVVIARVYWRIKNGWPTPVSQYSNMEITLSKVVHWALILGTIIMPLSGVFFTAMSGRGLDVFGLEVLAKNVDPDNIKKALAYSKELTSLGKSVHHWAGQIMIIAISLHVLGALKHHVIDKDGTLRRMLGKDV